MCSQVNDSTRAFVGNDCKWFID